MDNDSIGVDISKDHLDVHALSRGAAARFSNTPAGFRALTRWLGKPALARVVYEPTGFYHRAFEAYFEARLPLVRVNPLQARRFAQACGVRAKTDVIDAAVLARMGAALALEPDTPIGKNQRDLKGLHTARVTLVKEQTQLSNRLNACDLVLPRSQIKARITLVQHQIKEIDAEIARRLAEVPAKSRAKAILCRVPGLGVVSSAAVLAVMPELGQIGDKAAASLAGLAPHPRSSGKWRGTAHISGGRSALRQALYMPAVTACRFNPDFAAKYKALRAAGKPAKLAITVIMRKLLILANTLVRNDRLWTPKTS